MHAFVLHDGHDACDVLRRQAGELAVVNGHVGFAPRAVLRQHGTRYLMQHTPGHLLHAGKVGTAGCSILLI